MRFEYLNGGRIVVIESIPEDNSEKALDYAVIRSEERNRK